MIRKGTKIYPNTAKEKFWEKEPPKGDSKKLTPAKKAKAKASAKAAGRPYPNLVDNAKAARGK
jgi:hypothetical protein